MQRFYYKNIIKKYSDLSLNPDNDIFVTRDLPFTDYRSKPNNISLSNDVESDDLKVESLKWKFEVDYRSWGIKDISVFLPPQTIKIIGTQETWTNSGADDATYEPKDLSIDVDISQMDTELAGDIRLGISSVVPRSVELHDNKIIVNFN